MSDRDRQYDHAHSAGKRAGYDEGYVAGAKTQHERAQRIVRDFPLNICGYGAPMPAGHAASVEEFREAVLAALGKDDA